jgi:hypothetical protein
MRVYRLQVAYPEGSHDEHGLPVPGWQPPGWVPTFGYAHDDGPEPFGWPRVRAYLSRGGADKRADLLRSFGATVEVEASKPVEWEEATDASS